MQPVHTVVVWVVRGKRAFVCLCTRILGTPWQMPMKKVREVFREAVQIWSHVTPLTFTEVSEGHADINIDFAR